VYNDLLVMRFGLYCYCRREQQLLPVAIHSTSSKEGIANKTDPVAA